MSASTTNQAAAAVSEMPRSKVWAVRQNRRGDNLLRTDLRSARQKCLRRSGACANANRTTFCRRESRELVPALWLYAPGNVRPANARIMARLPTANGAAHGRQIARRLSRTPQRSLEFHGR